LSVSSDGSGGGIDSNDGLRSVDLDASDWDLKSNGDDVGIVHNVVGGVLSDASREHSSIDGDEVDEIEDLSNVNGE